MEGGVPKFVIRASPKNKGQDSGGQTPQSVPNTRPGGVRRAGGDNPRPQDTVTRSGGTLGTNVPPRGGGWHLVWLGTALSPDGTKIVRGHRGWARDRLGDTPGGLWWP